MERIQLDSPVSDMEGPNSSYLISGRDGLSLVDTGSPQQPQLEKIQSVINSHDYSIDELDDILLTHGHPDHVGLAGVLQEESDATVYLHQHDLHFLRSERSMRDGFAGDGDWFDEMGIPTQKREDLLSTVNASRDENQSTFPYPESIDAIKEGDTIQVGDTALEVLYTPGHTLGSVVYSFTGDAGQEAFTGDTLLPTYTPNIGADLRLENPLGRYLESIRRMGRNLDRAWPGHRGPIHDPKQRVNEVINHHQNRAELIFEYAVALESPTVWDITKEMFGDLRNIHILLGTAEVQAHVVYLEDHGLVYSKGDTFEVIDEERIVFDKEFEPLQ